MGSGKLAIETGSDVIKTLLVYDDLPLAQTAKVQIDRVLAQCGVKEHILRPWRADLLALRSFADAALAEALDASLIVVVLGRTGSLPLGLINWLEIWAGCRTIPDAALGLVCAPALSGSATMLEGELESLARRNRLTWLGLLGEGTKAEPKVESRVTGGEPRARERMLGPVLQDVMSGPARYRFYGLNE